MRVFIDRKEFPCKVKSVTYKRHYVNGKLPRGWEFQIRYEHDGETATLPVYAMSAEKNGDDYHLYTPNDLEWLLTNTDIGENELIESVEL